MTALSNLLLRLISASILLFIVILAFYLGSTAVTGLCCLVICVLCFEILKALGQWTRNRLLLILPALGMVVPFFIHSYMVTLLIVLIILGIASYPKELRWFRLIALLYIFLSLYVFLVLICEINEELNIRQPLFLLVVVIASDTGGYIFGKLFGKRKLMEKVSPNKTWEGSLGSVILSIIFWSLFLRGFADNLILEVILVILLCGCAQFGDLIESYAKRRLSIKDSGGIVPGHGGLFDRVDSIIGATFGYSVIIALGFGI